MLCILAWWLEPFSSDVLALQPTAIQSGAYWQFITANIVHTNGIHVLLNISGILLLWLVHGHYFTFSTYLITNLLLGLIVTLGLTFVSAELGWYGGLSGVLHGLFVIGAGKDMSHRLPTAWLLMAAIWLKIGYEQFAGQSEWIAGLIQANVAVDAHLYGAIGGLLWLLFDKIRLTKTVSPR
jgi:rhomboid family GlyGly-CTERM serine protease